jgi:3-oxoacyl-ACP reductase-like protein
MSIFGTILSKIFGHAEADKPAAAPAAPRPAAPSATAAAPKPAAPAPTQPVDVEAVLTQLAAAKGRPSNWQTSIVDLLALLDLDSSLTARKELGQELGIHVGTDGSAEQNIALHKAVMQKLAENGGKVPASLRD